MAQYKRFYGPIVYRLGRPVFNQVRGVRLPLGLRQKPKPPESGGFGFSDTL